MTPDTDIVTRLRHWADRYSLQPVSDELLEAAGEIERLRECLNIVANETDIGFDVDRVVVSLPAADYRYLLATAQDPRA